MIKGCQIFIPDTAFFTKDGRADCFIQNDKDGCLSYLLEQKKLQPSGISKKIQEIVRARQAKTDPHWCLVELNRRQNKGGKEKEMRTLAKSAKNFASPLMKGEETKKGQEFENAFEYAILRYRHRQEQKNEGFGATDTRNDLSSVVLSDVGDERDKRPPDSLKTT